MKSMKRPLFLPGQMVATPGALEAFQESGDSPITYLLRHLSGDWGEMDSHDKHANDRAVKDGTRLFSAYSLPTGTKIWVITEADRSSTTFLLPDEY